MFYVNGEPDTVVKARKLILESFADLEFYEDGHIYLLHGKQLNSVSGIGHRFIANPFDEAVQAIKYAQRHGETADYWIKKWRCNSFRATTLGTKTHEFGESLGYLKAGHPELIRDSIRAQYNETYNYLAPIHPKEEAVELFMKELPSSYHLVLNEAKVYSGKNPDSSKNLKEQICGTFDMLYWYDGNGDETKAGFVILDYKTNGNLYSEYNRKYRRMLLSPFDNLVEEDYGLYIIQLNLSCLSLFWNKHFDGVTIVLCKGFLTYLHAICKLYHMNQVQIITYNGNFLTCHNIFRSELLELNILSISQFCLSSQYFTSLINQLNFAYFRTIFRNYYTYLAGNTSLNDFNVGNRVHTRYDDLSHLVKVATQETQCTTTNHRAGTKHVQCNTLLILVCYQIILATARQQQS